VVALLDASADDTFLEIGPGRGALTLLLAPRVRRLVAVEIDRDLAAALASQAPANTDIVAADFLTADLDALLTGASRPVRVAGNLPYNISSPVLFRLIRFADEGRRFSDATVMLQAEVADRLAAAPGKRGYGVLAVQAGLLADIDRLLTLPPGAFRPAPRVSSAIVRLRFRPALADPGSLAAFERVVRGVFLHRRKTLLNAFKPVALSFGRLAETVIADAGLRGSDRPEQLTVEEMARLSRAVL
jgi:16S rRNA (adenine1518-N6/adenine1519-N6)-dimethyltransferase